MGKIKPRLRLKVGNPVMVQPDAVPEEIFDGKSKLGRIVWVYQTNEDYDYSVDFGGITGSYPWDEVDPLTEEELCAYKLLEV